MSGNGTPPGTNSTPAVLPTGPCSESRPAGQSGARWILCERHRQCAMRRSGQQKPDEPGPSLGFRTALDVPGYEHYAEAVAARLEARAAAVRRLRTSPTTRNIRHHATRCIAQGPALPMPTGRLQKAASRKACALPMTPRSDHAGTGTGPRLQAAGDGEERGRGPGDFLAPPPKGTEPAAGRAVAAATGAQGGSRQAPAARASSFDEAAGASPRCTASSATSRWKPSGFTGLPDPRRNSRCRKWEHLMRLMRAVSFFSPLTH